MVTGLRVPTVKGPPTGKLAFNTVIACPLTILVAQRSMQYTDYAWNRKKHITSACDITEERYGILFMTQRKRAGHKAA